MSPYHITAGFALWLHCRTELISKLMVSQWKFFLQVLIYKDIALRYRKHMAKIHLLLLIRLKDIYILKEIEHPLSFSDVTSLS